ncbi:MAG TPA: hypothetical protein VN759_01865 [Pseudolysinimonas sp.]|nr:hypothetical protein [Pseudolysinimonas sp.]
MASNASGNQSESAQTWDEVDSGQSDDIENSLTGQGTSDREMTKDVDRDEAVEDDERTKQHGGGGHGI